MSADKIANLVIQGTQVELTDALRSFVHEKVGDALRALGDMSNDPSLRIDCELEANRAHHRKGQVYRAEVNLTVRDRLLRAEATSDDMYRAITEMKHVLTRQIREWREKRTDAARDGARSATDLVADEMIIDNQVEDWSDEDEASS